MRRQRTSSACSAPEVRTSSNKQLEARQFGGGPFERHRLAAAAGKCDLIAVGRPILANPDLVTRWKTGAAVNAPDSGTFYTPGPKGYVDYPGLKM